MSVIVKGMKMPENCDSCWIPGSFCPLWFETDVGNRHQDCPLVELPEKHGRLGDLDELQALFRECIDECKKWIQEVKDGGDVETILIARQSFNTFVEANLKTRKIPTIVEAEGDDA